MANGVSDWIVESCTTTGTGDLILTGANLGYNKFKGAVPAGTVWYEVYEGNNKEAGLGTYDGDSTIVRTTVHSTLVGNIFDNSSPTPISLNGSALVACTFNAAAYEELYNHTVNTSNPHSVTKTQVGLGNVDNTSDVNKPISTAAQAALDEKVKWFGTHVALYNYPENSMVKKDSTSYVSNASTTDTPPSVNWDVVNSDGIDNITNLYDNVDSTSTSLGLTANMGKYLYDLYLADANIDGGYASETYLAAQVFDGGNA